MKRHDQWVNLALYTNNAYYDVTADLEFQGSLNLVLVLEITNYIVAGTLNDLDIQRGCVYRMAQKLQPTYYVIICTYFSLHCFKRWLTA